MNGDGGPARGLLRCREPMAVVVSERAGVRAAARAVAPLAELDATPRRVAVVRALNVGDLLVAVPALRALRRALPAARITLVGLPWAAEMVRRFPRYLDDLLPFPGFPGIEEAPFDAGRLIACLADARERAFDLAIQMHGGGRYSNPFTRMLGATRTAGFVAAGDASGLDFPFPYVDRHHEVHRYLDLVAFLTGVRGDDRLEFPLEPADRDEVARCLGPDPEPYLVVHPGSRVASRRWMPERFAAVAEALAREEGLDVVVSGGPGEGPLVEHVRRRLRCRTRRVSVDIGLGGLAALLAGARIVVSNDTAAAHLADAVGAPSVVIYGSAHVANWGPLDTSRHRTLFVPMACRPDHCRPCPFDHRCLAAITPDAVVAAARELLA
ncbi:MAG TPA: glycosyltransferase family 9 protein [Thermodesulfobacteriota bacterium]